MEINATVEHKVIVTFTEEQARAYMKLIGPMDSQLRKNKPYNLNHDESEFIADLYGLFYDAFGEIDDR